MKEITVRIKIYDDTSTSEISQIIGEALEYEGVDFEIKTIEE